MKTKVNILGSWVSRVSMLLDSDAEWPVFDLFDMQNNFAVYKTCMFSTCAHEFFNTSLSRKYDNDI